MIERQAFGRTGHVSSRVVFGAVALAGVSRADAEAAIELLLESGVNHIDTAADYGDSEERLGDVLRTRRDAFFIGTKTGERGYRGARRSIHRSLERLRTDRIDLIQLHNLVDRAEWDEALGSDGALRAFLEARAEGLVRFVGVTGHGEAVAGRHVESLERHPFDSVLVPYGPWLRRYPEHAAEVETLLERCAALGVAVQTIKAIARRPWPSERDAFARTWYEPFRDPADIRLAVHWVLARPDVFLNSAGDLELLPHILSAAATFEAAPAEDDVEHLLRERDVSFIF